MKLSNLPPGVTDEMIERQAGAFDEHAFCVFEDCDGDPIYCRGHFEAEARRAERAESDRAAMLEALAQIERLSRTANGSMVDVRAMLGDIARAAIAKAEGK